MTSDAYTETGMKVVRGQDIGAGRDLEFKEQVFVGEETVTRLRRSVVRQGDLVLPHRGAIGRVGIVGSEDLMLSTSMMKITLDQRVCIPEFYLYYLRGPGKQKLLEHASVVGTPGIAQPLSALRSIRVPTPPLETQRAIAEVLGALDDKIAANQRVQSAADQTAAALVEKDLVGAVPLGAISIVVMGTSPRGDTLNEGGDGVEFFQGVRDFGFRVPTARVFTTNPVKQAAAGDLLVSVRAPVGSINRVDRPLCIGRGLAAVRSTTDSPCLLFHALRAARAAWEPFNHEGTVFGSINQSDLRKIEIPWVDPALLAGIEKAIQSLEQRIDQCVGESRHLATLRDTLLPHLMSGRLTVRKAEEAVEAAL